MIKILEVDQWSSTGNITDFGFKDFDLQKIEGGDAKAARSIFGGRHKVKDVSENDSPNIGNVWFRENEKTGKFEYYRANCDSSD